ncbi:PAS domain S-box protein [Alsobacter sp. SYSU BS001988]
MQHTVATPSRRAISTQLILIVLIIGLLVPVVAFTGLVLNRYAAGEKSRYEIEALERARAVASAVDRELSGLQSALQVLATSRLWDTRNFEQLYQQATEVKSLLDAAIVVKSVDGQQIVNTRLPFGSVLPVSLPEGDKRAIATKKPTVSDLFSSATTGLSIVSLNVPIIREGRVVGLISAGLEPGRFARLLVSQGLPEAWTGALVDETGAIIARSRQHERFVGAQATADLRQNAVGIEGLWVGTTVEGTPVLSAYARSTISGWKAAVGVPIAAVQVPLRRSLLWLIGFGGAALGVSVIIAAWCGRKIASALHSLAASARALGAAQAVTTPHTVLREVNAVAEALSRAGVDLAERARARDRAEADLEQSKERLERILNTSPVAIVETDDHGVITYANRASERMLGLERSDIEGRRYDAPDWVSTTSDGRPMAQEELPVSRALRGETATNITTAVSRAAGERVVLSVNATPIWDDGRVVGALAAFTDISDRDAAENALRAETERLDTLNRTGAAIASELELDRIVQVVTDAGVDLTGAAFGAFFYNVVNDQGESYTLYTISGVPREHFSKFPMPRNTHVFAPTFEGQGPVRSDDITKDERYGRNAPHAGMPEGHLPVRSYLAVPVMSRSGEVIGGLFFGHPQPGIFSERHERLLIGIASQAAVAIDNARLFQAAQHEISARRQTEEALRRSEERFRTAVRAVSGVIWTNSASGHMEGDQPGWAALTGQGSEEYQGYGWTHALHPDDVQPTITAWEKAVGERGTFLFEHRVRRKDGEWGLFSVRAIPVLGDDGAIREWVGVHTDITDQRAAEAELRSFNERLEHEVAQRTTELKTSNAELLASIAQREMIEEQLRQAQKMEAVGQLTGGIAHDFNNLLAVIQGSLELLQRRLDRGQVGSLQRFVNNAREGAERATALTQRLLAFSRQQALAPVPIEPNRLLSGLSDLLRRSLGEHIRMETVLAGGLWRTHADPHQLEQAILNLAVNSRDAMPEGGRLTIETMNCHLDERYARENPDVAPGQYVLIAVTDTGTGIPANVLDKVFEPFFTTKPVGKGTGLGLSQVYGFVRQSGGHIKVYSEQGCDAPGTTVKIYLPRFLGSALPDSEGEFSPPLPTGLLETILVVEDDAAVRQMTTESLLELGYRVREADGAMAALRILDSEPHIDLMFTDIVMPEVNGAKLAEEARRRCPDLKVLFTTGYSRNAIVHNGVLDPGVHVLMKPFSHEQLATKLRELLG